MHHRKALSIPVYKDCYDNYLDIYFSVVLIVITKGIYYKYKKFRTLSLILRFIKMKMWINQLGLWMAHLLITEYQLWEFTMKHY